jgi:hypothetical protein
MVKRMPAVFAGTPAEYNIDGYVLGVLDTAKKVITKDWDMIFCADGGEGTGKSVFVQQAAYYCDPTLTLDRITFTPREFREAVMKAQPYQAVVYDEAFTGLNSRAAMSIINRALVSMLAEIRQKNLFIFVVMPTFFDLDKYVALWRSRGLFHIYTGDNFARGLVAFYNIDKKKDLYIQGKKFYSYTQPRPNFVARFPNHYTVDKAAYKLKKLHSLSDREKKAVTEDLERQIQEELWERVQTCEIELTHTVKMAILNLSSATYFRKLARWNSGREVS